MSQADPNRCVVNLLVRLGRTSDEIAERLLAGGHRGRVGHNTNPISIYLSACGFRSDPSDPDDGMPFVDIKYAVGLDIARHGHLRYVLYPQLTHVRAFLIRFNQGRYPQLIAT